MKSVSCKLVGIAVLVVLTSRGGALAGVVMAETSFAAGAREASPKTKRFTYREINKKSRKKASLR
jgi:hypothetical protein